MLCENRFDSTGNPSTCLLDTILLPLPSFLLIAGVFAVVVFSSIRYNPDQLQQSDDRRSYFVPRWTKTCYILLLVAALGMNLLQISRLAHDQQGVGLLPFTLVGIIFAMLLSRSSHFPSYYLLLPYWLLWTAFEALAVVRLMELGELYPDKTSLYPSSDRLLDNIVLLVLYTIFLFYEAWALCMRIIHYHKERRQSNESVWLRPVIEPLNRTATHEPTEDPPKYRP